MKLKLIYVISICTICRAYSFGQQVEDEDFNVFIKKFSEDSLFQISRVTFPLEFVHLNDESFTMDTALVGEKDYVLRKGFYNVLRKCVEAYPIIYDNFECSPSQSKERVFRWKGFTGMDERFYFQMRDGKWYLLRMSLIGT